MTTQEFIVGIWNCIKVIANVIVMIISGLYETFGVGFIIFSVIIFYICCVCVFGGLIDDYDEYRKQKNMKNLEGINRKLKDL